MLSRLLEYPLREPNPHQVKHQRGRDPDKDDSDEVESGHHSRVRLTVRSSTVSERHLRAFASVDPTAGHSFRGNSTIPCWISTPISASENPQAL